MTTFLQPARRTAARDAVVRLHEQLSAEGREVPLRLWDGSELGPDDHGYRLVLPRPWSLRSLLFPPSDLSAGEAYLAGDVDVEGSMVAGLRDVGHLVADVSWRSKLRLAATLARLPSPPRQRSNGRVRLHGRAHSRTRDMAAVRHHYDVGNEFYRLILDRRMVYSCAYVDEADRDRPVTDRAVLDRAQERKLDLICRKLALRPEQRLLDVGCGWGALVVHAAERYGVQAVGITLSEKQAELARKLAADAGLTDRVEIRVQDYRDVTERFDAVASVGMVEHVGADMLPRYLRCLYDRLEEGGLLLNHGITTGGRGIVRDMAAEPDSFIGRYVFPDGCLLPASAMVRLIETTGFEILDVEQLRPHYARTLQHWTANLEASADEARRLVGERRFRTWRAYLAGSAVGFEHNDLGVIQVLASRGSADLPFGRDRMLLGS